MNDKYYKILRFDGKEQYSERKNRKNIKEYLNKYIDEEIYNKKAEIVDKQIVTGCTCLEYDRLFTLLNKPRLSVGDKIVYHNVGAYTMSLTPMFIRYVPDIYVKKSKDYFLVRKKFEAKDYLLNTVF